MFAVVLCNLFICSTLFCQQINVVIKELFGFKRKVNCIVILSLFAHQLGLQHIFSIKGLVDEILNFPQGGTTLKEGQSRLEAFPCVNMKLLEVYILLPVGLLGVFCTRDSRRIWNPHQIKCDQRVTTAGWHSEIWSKLSLFEL